MEYKLNATQMQTVIIGLSLADEHLTSLITDLSEMVNGTKEPLVIASPAKPKRKPSAKATRRSPTTKPQPSPLKSAHHPFGCQYGCKLFYSKKGSRDKHHHRVHAAELAVKNAERAA